MIKKSLIVASLFIGGTHLLAQENTFIGIGLGDSEITASLEGTSITSDSEALTSFKIGKEFNDYRMYGKYLTINPEGDTLTVFSANYDKYLVNENEIKVFIGGEIGYLNYSSDVSFGGDKLDASGLTYGFNVGTIFAVTEQITFETGYGYMLASASDKTCVEAINGTCTYNATINIDRYDSFKFGINYQF